jgi:hypothetical protein
MVLLMVALFLGGQSLFAQYTLPEPVFEPAAAPAVAEQPGSGQVESASAGTFWLPDFAEIVYYLWDAAPEGAGGAHHEFESLAVLAAAAGSDAGGFIPRNIRNNQYFIESVRLTNLAQQSYESGDYDASTVYAEEAMRYARLSDEYVALQLKIKETNDAIAAAKARLDYAASIGAAGRYPAEYDEARNAYNSSLSLRSAEDWDGAIAAASRVINALAYIRPPADPPPQQPSVESTPLPAQYTVRAWAVSKDCLWNIAGRPWAYGDPAKWRLIYNANRSRMPQPDNPDLIHPGMVLDIPSVKGELRQGMWDAGRTYTPLP